jgi:hypothetical protein
MSDPIKSLKVMVIDHGRFFHIAQRLSRDVDHVYYWAPAERDSPLLRECCVGDGFEEVERVDSPWDVKDECDLFVFVDVGFAGMQAELVSQGLDVWGARSGDRLEMSRGYFLKELEQAGLAVPHYEKIKGLTNLQLHLKDKEDKWIKVSKFRGDFETMHYTNWRQDEVTLDGYAVRFGPLKEQIVFFVFDPIDAVIEDGCDTWCIDGQWPKTVLHAMEMKDKCLIGALQPMADLPDEVKSVNEAFGPILASHGYRSFFSTEVRITEDGESYFIDPTCRAGSPPSQVQCELYSNYAEIIWRGAQGECVEPEPAAKFGVQVALKTDGDRTEWIAVELPKELDQWVKCGFCCKVDSRICFPPVTEYHTSDLGYLCAIGDTLDEAVESLREKRDLLPDGLKCDFTSLAELLKDVKAAEDHSIELTTEPVPEPAEALK